MSVTAGRLRLLLLALSAEAASAAGAARPPIQLLPLPTVTAAPLPAPLPPPTNPGFAPAPENGISPLLLQPGPAFPLPRSEPSTAYPPPSLPGPIDQQKLTSYRMWLQGQERLLERGGGPDAILGREIRQQLLQLDQSGSPR